MSGTIKSPNFFVAGAQKSGTSYLCAQLAKHPDVFLSTIKEPMFFNRPGYQEIEIVDYLRQHFAAVKNEKWVGEGSTLYFQNFLAPERIAKVLGSDLHFIICLRHPVEKAISLYLHNFRRGRLSGRENILELDSGPLAVVPWSHYAESVKRYSAIFGKDHLRFLLFDQLVEDPSEFVRSATDFLGIPELERIDAKKINAGLPLVKSGTKIRPAGAIKLSGKNAVQPEFDYSDLENLQECYREDLRETEDLIGKSLESWQKLPYFDTIKR